MSRVYVTEPGTTGGVGAMGMRILVSALRDAGHEITRVQLWRQRRGDGDQMPLLGGGHESISDATLLPAPDAWFVSLLYVRQWVDLPDMFRRMGLAPRSRDRQPTDPLVAFGGQSMIAPAPVEAFADILAMGDGEITGARIAGLLDVDARKTAVLDALHDERGYYVPGRSTRLRRIDASTYEPRLVHDDEGHRGASIIEVARGCKSKCAFCPIGWAGGRYREAPPTVVKEALVRLRGRSVNLFAPDYSSVTASTDYESWLATSGCKNAGRDARMDAAARHIDAARDVKSYNFGVEGLSERLRRAIGKPLSHDRIVDTMRQLSDKGVKQVRWYMILGLPGEGDDDFSEFLTTAEESRKAFAGGLDVTCTHIQSVPHTPLQWIDNRYDEAAAARGVRMRERFRELYQADGRRMIASEMKGRQLHEHDAWLQRAGHDASEYLIALDGRKAWLADGRWRDIAGDISAGLGAIVPGSVTPWSHIDVGIDPKLVLRGWETYQRALSLPGHRAA